MDRYQTALNTFREELLAGDGKKLEMHLKASSEARRGLG